MTGRTATDHAALLAETVGGDGAEERAREMAREIEASIKRLHDLRARHVNAIVEIDDEVEKLATMKASLPKPTRKVKQRTALQKAGPGNVEKVYAMIVSGGPSTQARITSTLGINNGTVTWALRALVETKRIAETGKRVNGSKEYAAKRPRRRSTTVAESEMALA
jgi:hypothetical protein